MKALLSSEGRLSRNGYLKFFVAPLVGLIAFTWLTWVAAPDLFGGMPAMVFTVPWMLFLATADALNIRRWHDLGVSGSLYRLARPFVVMLPAGAMFVQFILPSLMASTGDYNALAFLIGQDLGGWSIQPVPLALLGLTLVGVIGNVAYLSAMPGQKGPNDHGPDPDGGVSVFAPGDAAQSEENDPVKRALAEYQARHAAAMVKQVRPAPQGSAFGKRRSI